MSRKEIFSFVAETSSDVCVVAVFSELVFSVLLLSVDISSRSSCPCRRACSCSVLFSLLLL